MLIHKSSVGQLHMGPTLSSPVAPREPSERAIAYKVDLREKFILGGIERERIMRWCECPTEKLAANMRTSE